MRWSCRDLSYLMTFLLKSKEMVRLEFGAVLDWENGKWEMSSGKTGKFPLSHLVDEVGKWKVVVNSGKLGIIELFRSCKSPGDSSLAGKAIFFVILTTRLS